MYMYIHICIYICIYIYMSAERGKMASSRPCAWQRGKVRIHIYIDTHTYIYIHTNIHIFVGGEREDGL